MPTAVSMHADPQPDGILIGVDTHFHCLLNEPPGGAFVPHGLPSEALVHSLTQLGSLCEPRRLFYLLYAGTCFIY